MSPPKGPSSRAVGQPLPWAQVPLVPAEMPGAVPRLAGAAVVLCWCSVLPGCPRAESLCDRRDRAQPVVGRGSVPRCHHCPSGHGAIRGNWQNPVIQYPVSCSGPTLYHLCQAPRHSPTPRGCPGRGWHRGEAVMGTELNPSLCCQCQGLCPLCAECCISPAPAPATFLAWFHRCDHAGQA